MENFGDRMFGPISAKQEAAAKAALAEIEQGRQRSMAQYEIDKLPPFMRASKTKIAK